MAPCGPDAARWRGGYALLPAALAAGLRSAPRLGCNVRAIERAGGTVRLSYDCAGSAGTTPTPRYSGALFEAGENVFTAAVWKKALQRTEVDCNSAHVCYEARG